MMLILSGVSTIVVSGCGGGSSDSYVPEVTYYLQTYNAVNQAYEGVQDVYYECGPDIVGYTNSDGAFTMIEGDYCTFYDLDDTVSYEYGLLYIGLDRWGDIAVTDIRYNCDSGISDYTDQSGSFVYDPAYISPISNGDVCEFQF